MLLQMLLGSMNHLQRNKLESKINIPCLPSPYPLFSNRPMISPTNPLMTPSGLMAIKVCSVDIFRVSGIVCCELKSLVIWKASVKVIKLKMKVVKKIKRVVIHRSKKKFSSKFLQGTWTIVKATKPAHRPRTDIPHRQGPPESQKGEQGKVCVSSFIQMYFWCRLSWLLILNSQKAHDDYK